MIYDSTRSANPMDEVSAANNRLRSQHRGADFGVMVRNAYTGSNFDDFLAEEGVLDEVTARAYKRLWDLQVQDAMTEAHLSRTELAGRLQTSRSQLDRLLDPENTSVTLDSLERLARAIGKQLVLRLA